MAFSLQIKAANTQPLPAAIEQVVTEELKGEKLITSGKHKEALEIFKRTTPKMEKLLGKKHVATAKSYLYLGICNSFEGDPEAGIEFCNKAADIFESNSHESTAFALELMSQMHMGRSEHDKAIPVLERLVRFQTKKTGKQSEKTTAALNFLATSYHSSGNYAKSAEICEIILANAEKMNGKSSLEAAVACTSLSNLYTAMGDYSKALPFALQALVVNEKIRGNDHPDTATCVNNLGILYSEMADHLQALPLFNRALAIREKALRDEHPDTASTLNSLGLLYKSIGDYTKALALLERALAIYQKALGAEHPDTATCVNNLGMLHSEMGDYGKALSLCERASFIREKAFGPDHPDTAQGLNNVAEIYSKTGDYKKALPLQERALAINEKALGADSPKTATSLNNLAQVYLAMGNYLKSQQLHERALTIAEKALGPDHPDVAGSLNNLAVVCSTMGEYAKAMQFHNRALAIHEETYGSENPILSASLNNIANIYQSMGDYTKALPLLERALAIKEKALGPEHPDTGLSLNNLAGFYQAMGDYTQAQLFYERALLIREKALGPEHPDTGMSLNNLGGFYQSMGDYTQALLFYERALSIREKALGPEHPDMASSLNNLAELYRAMGDYSKALPLSERALAIKEKAHGPNHPDIALSLNNLGLLYGSMGDYSKVLPHYERALAIKEQALGPDHPDVARSLHNLAGYYCSKGNFTTALPIYDRALAILEKSLGPEHPDVAQNLNNLASLYESMGNYSLALPLHERALAINEKALGPKNPQTAVCLGNLADLKYKMGSLSEARFHADRHITAKQSELQTILAQDEGTRLSWQSVNQSFWLACLLEPDAITDMVLRMKGVVLDSLVEDRSIALAAQSSSDGSESLKKITQLQARLSKLAFEPGQEEEVARIEGEISQLQRDMAAKYLGRNLQRASATITQEDITTTLGEGSALIDLFQFQDPKLKGDEWDCLGAIIMAANNNLEFVRIDGAKVIRQSIESLRQGIANGDAACVKEETELLSEKLWRPIAQKIPEGTNQLVISPDGDLNFLSFAALLSEDGKFLAESYDISYVGNARDLLRESNPNPPNRIRIFGNPIFDQATEPVEENRLAFRSMEVDVFGQIQLPPLPGTEKECAEIQKIAANSGWDLETFTRDRADEKNIRGTSKPGILHLATHGFYLNSYTPPIESTRGMSVIGVETSTTNKKGVDPMRASGIALTGAQSTLRSWAERKAPDPENDGILTAEEVAALDLQGTWLVALSACETGVGEARSGEGVLGLRRSFMMAGAENLLMTLWPVSDHTTSEIMADFYSEALKTGNAPGSLAKVQRDWLVKLRKEKGLLEAVRDAGPFVMATIGKPLPPLPRVSDEKQSLYEIIQLKLYEIIN